MGVLVTRPEPGATETAGRIAALGFTPIVAPVLDIRRLHAPLPPSAEVQAILASSGNAIASLPASHYHLPLYAVGAATAERAREAGFVDVTSADRDAGALANLLAQRCNPAGAPLLLATGRGQGRSLAKDLRQRRFAVIRRAVYAATGVPTLSKLARDAFVAGELFAALFFSAETARHGVTLLQSARLQEAVRSVDALAIGQPAGVALQALPWRRILIAARPNQDAMLALLR